MNGTFMFGEDRFGPAEDFFATYRAVGGERLSGAVVDRAVNGTVERLWDAYADPRKRDDFPSVAEALRRHASVPDSEIQNLEAVIAVHELGHVPAEFTSCLRRLAASYRLGIVSNIWAHKGPWLRHFEEVGLGRLWRTAVFSSDTRSIKPSPVLFLQAIGEMGLEAEELLFVGDKLEVDVAPAKALGLRTAWVGPMAEPHPLADWVMPSLLDLEEALR